MPYSRSREYSNISLPFYPLTTFTSRNKCRTVWVWRCRVGQTKLLQILPISKFNLGVRGHVPDGRACRTQQISSCGCRAAMN